MKRFFLFFVILVITISTNAQQNGLPRPQRPPLDHRPRGENREKIEMYKIQFITEKLSLTKSEAEQFWPVYEAHKNVMKDTPPSISVTGARWGCLCGRSSQVKLLRT